MRWRGALRDRPAAEFGYRAGVAVVGTAVLVVGIVAIPYPGPGWAILFVGLGILATEFRWAKHASTSVRDRYDAAMAWFRRQGIWVQGLSAAVTAAVVLATLWFVGAIDWSARVAGVDWPWLDSPIGLGS